MVEVTNELIYTLMLEIQGEQKAMRAEQDILTHKVGTVAAGMVSINKRLDDLDASTRLIAVAVDEHTHQLTRIEKHLGLVTAE
jgi:hypothetical protein